MMKENLADRPVRPDKLDAAMMSPADEPRRLGKLEAATTKENLADRSARPEKLDAATMSPADGSG
jgi:hypothetical protein